MILTLYIICTCIQVTVVKANLELASFTFISDQATCSLVSSYITFGDFFMSNSTRNINNNNNHYWTVGLVVNGVCTTEPPLMLTSHKSKKITTPLYLMPFISDDYKFTVGDSDYIGVNNTKGQVYERTSYQYKITGEHLNDYGVWQTYLEHTEEAVKYDFPDLNSYLSPDESKNSNKKEQKFMIVADMDATDPAKHTINKTLTRTNEIDIYMHVGDFAYDIFDSNGYTGDNFFSMLSPSYSKKPYIITPGNHERQDDFKFFNYRFRMPGGNNNITTRNNYFSFKIKDTYFLSINQDYWQNSADYQKNPLEERNKLINWMSEDIKNAKDDVRFKVFFTHRPTFCGRLDKKDCNSLFYYFKFLEDFQKKHKFDLVLQAHVHAYTRFNHIYNFNKTDSESSQVSIGSEYKNPLYIVSGHAGTTHDFIKDHTNESSIVGSSYVSGSDGNYIAMSIDRESIVGELRDSTDDNLQDYWMITPQIPSPSPDNNYDDLIFWLVLGICIFLSVGNVFACFVINCIRKKREKNNRLHATEDDYAPYRNDFNSSDFNIRDMSKNFKIIDPTESVN